jgi:hypothetical protein
LPQGLFDFFPGSMLLPQMPAGLHEVVPHHRISARLEAAFPSSSAKPPHGGSWRRITVKSSSALLGSVAGVSPRSVTIVA